MANSSYREFDNWPDPVLLVDADGQIVHVNDPAVTSFGYSYNEFVELSVSDIASMMPVERQAWVKAMYSLVGAGSSGGPGVELLCVGKNGSSFRAHVSFEYAQRLGTDWRWIQIHVAPSVPTLGLTTAGSDDSQPEHRLLIESSVESELPDLVDQSGKLAVLKTMLWVDTIVDQIASEVSDLLPIDAFGMATVDTERKTAHLRQWISGEGSPQPVRDTGDKYSLRGTVMEKAAELNKTTLVTARNPEIIWSEFPGLASNGRKTKFLSTLVSPLRISNRVSGMAIVKSAEPFIYSKGDVEKLARLVRSI